MFLLHKFDQKKTAIRKGKKLMKILAIFDNNNFGKVGVELFPITMGGLSPV